MFLHAVSVGLKVKAAQPGQPDVEHKAPGDVRKLAAQELRCRSERRDLQVDRPEKALDRFPRGRIIIHDEDDRRWLGSFFHVSPSATPVGRVIRRANPRGRRGDAERRPPWASTIDRQIDNPIPIP
jgi:hypothetical protein